MMRNNLKIAANGLRNNKWRSFLTMLGIIIGVSSVITVISIGQGIKQQIGKQINHVGKNLITIRPGQVPNAGLRSLTTLSGGPSNGSLSIKDLQTVKKTPGVASVAPLGILSGTVKAERGNYTDGPVIMTSPDFTSLINQSVAYGTFLSDDEAGNNVAILGSHAAITMFNAHVPLGETFNFRGQDFIVDGVMNDFPIAPLSTDVDFNNAVFISTDAGERLSNGNSGLYEILAKSSSADPTAASAAITGSLSQERGDEHDFSVLLTSQTEAQTNSVLTLLTELIAGVAAISLFVGGIGIMNIMLVSVTERIHEIGIRKAVGATNRQILNEFVAEATVLCIVGSLFGVLVACGVNVVLRVLTSLTPVFDWRVMVISAAIAVVVGVLFGSAPALKAARKDPISALRNE